MKRNATSWLIAVGVVAGMLALSPSRANAGDWQRKLGRGVNNVMFGAVELPRTIHSVSKMNGGGAGGTWGAIKGIHRFIGREVIGVAEIITAPINTKVAIRPEFLLSTDQDDYYQTVPW